MRTLDGRTGEVVQLIDGVSSGAISPEGKRLAFGQALPLDKYGLFVSNLDGSNLKMLSNGHPYVVTMPSWPSSSRIPARSFRCRT